MKHLKQATFGKAPWAKLKRPEDYVCKRSGGLSFDRDSWEAFKSSPLGGESANYDRFTAPYADSLECVRIFFNSIGAKGSKSYIVPQLSMYLPESGYPLCASTRSRDFKRGGTWPGKARKYFVTMPIQHIIRGLYGLTHSDHQLTVFDLEMPPFDSVNIHPLVNKDRGLYGKSQAHMAPFVTDLNSCLTLDAVGALPKPNAPKDEDTSHWFNVWIYDKWGSDMTMEERCEVRDYFIGGALNSEEFEAYLAYWMLLYPNKYIAAKGDCFGSLGTAPDEVESSQGYVRYLPNNFKEDYFYGDNRALGTIYELEAPQATFGTKTDYGPSPIANGRDFISYVSSLSQGFYAKYEKHKWFGQRALLHMGIVRAYLNKNKISGHNFYPFKAPRYASRTDMHRVPPKVVNTLSQVMRYRTVLEQGSELVMISDFYCRKCGESLIVPKLLADQKPKLKRLVCHPCGAKYLTNLAHTLLPKDKKWFYYEDYPLAEAFPLLEF